MAQSQSLFAIGEQARAISTRQKSFCKTSPPRPFFAKTLSGLEAKVREVDPQAFPSLLRRLSGANDHAIFCHILGTVEDIRGFDSGNTDRAEEANHLVREMIALLEPRTSLLPRTVDVWLKEDREAGLNDVHLD